MGVQGQRSIWRESDRAKYRAQVLAAIEQHLDTLEGCGLHQQEIKHIRTLTRWLAQNMPAAEHGPAECGPNGGCEKHYPERYGLPAIPTDSATPGNGQSARAVGGSPATPNPDFPKARDQALASSPRTGAT